MPSKIPFENTFASLPDRFYQRTSPEKAPDPTLVVANDALATELGIAFGTPQEVAEELSGARVPEGSTPLALAYAGHQFGHFAPQLGDGRAVLLGEVQSRSGERFDVQLKGSGRTKFSRQGDGKCPLGPALREYLVSEFMHAVDLPTTRSLAITLTGEQVYRGHEQLPGAVLTRVASSHLRIGTFEYFASRGDWDGLELLLSFAVARHFPELGPQEQDQGLACSPEVICAFFEAFTKRTGVLISRWMGLGFVHGVMNTDNMAISGETIDYGPCAFMDVFQFDQVFSSIDTHGRYRYEAQPHIAAWNCARLADCLLALARARGLEVESELQGLARDFIPHYRAEWLREFGEKLGLSEPESRDEELIHSLLAIMHEQGSDFTITFRQLGQILRTRDQSLLSEEFKPFLESWLDRLGADHQASQLEGGFEGGFEGVAAGMGGKNPIYIPRNHLVEKAIADAYQGDYSFFHRLRSIFATPFHPQEDGHDFERGSREGEWLGKTFCGT